MPSQCEAALVPIAIGALAAASPAMASGCAMASNESAVQASSANSSGRRERRWRERRMSDSSIIQRWTDLNVDSERSSSEVVSRGLVNRPRADAHQLGTDFALQPAPNACPVPRVFLVEVLTQISLLARYDDERHQSNRGEQRDQEPGTVDPDRDSNLK